MDDETVNDDRPFEPDWTVHPGVCLDELLDLRGWTAAGLAQAAGMALEVVDGILDGTVPVDEGAARKFSLVFAVSSQFWRNYQANYDADIARGVTTVVTARRRKSKRTGT